MSFYNKRVLNKLSSKHRYHLLTYTFMCPQSHHASILSYNYHIRTINTQSIFSSWIRQQRWYNYIMVFIRLKCKGIDETQVQSCGRGHNRLYFHHWGTYTFIGHCWTWCTDNDLMMLRVYRLMSTSSNSISPWILAQVWYKLGMELLRLISKGMVNDTFVGTRIIK